MKTNRRDFVTSAAATASLGLLASAARADTCAVPPEQTTLIGTWMVKCPICGQVDKVEGGTRQHCCSRNKQHQVFHEGGVTVLCPVNHENFVRKQNKDDLVRSWPCSVDQRECCRTPPSSRPNIDRGGR